MSSNYKKIRIIEVRISESLLNDEFIEIFVRMLTIHCDENNSYEITIIGF